MVFKSPFLFHILVQGASCCHLDHLHSPAYAEKRLVSLPHNVSCNRDLLAVPLRNNTPAGCIRPRPIHLGIHIISSGQKHSVHPIQHLLHCLKFSADRENERNSSRLFHRGRVMFRQKHPPLSRQSHMGDPADGIVCLIIACNPNERLFHHTLRSAANPAAKIILSFLKSIVIHSPQTPQQLFCPFLQIFCLILLTYSRPIGMVGNKKSQVPPQRFLWYPVTARRYRI